MSKNNCPIKVQYHQQLKKLAETHDLLTINEDQYPPILKDMILQYRHTYNLFADMLDSGEDSKAELVEFALRVDLTPTRQKVSTPSGGLLVQYFYSNKPGVCPRCNGRKYIPQFKHIEGGRCFACCDV